MTPLEVIVVDDGSTDATEEVCATFGGQVRSVRLKNGGVSRARNIGAKMARGEWLVFLDADDVLLPNALAALLECAERRRAWLMAW